MKAVCMNRPGEIRLKDIEETVMRHGEALIRVRAVGICGSDIGAFRGTNTLVSYPRIIGHEIAGEIVEISGGDGGLKPGSGGGLQPSGNGGLKSSGDDGGLKPGDRVIVDPYLYCGKCYPCSLGRTNCCEDLKVLGVHVDGGMSEFMVHPSNMLTRLPDSIEWENAPLAEPVTIALHAIHRTRLKAGEHIAINGAGAIGLLAALCAMSYKAIPIIVDVVQERLDYARKIGVKNTINLIREDLLGVIGEITNGRMAEVVAEASGSNQAIRNTLDMASYAGRIALTGWPSKETPLPTDMITKKELDIMGARTSAGEFEEAVGLMTSGEFAAQAVLSKVIGFDEIPGMVKELSDHPDRYLKINALL